VKEVFTNVPENLSETKPVFRCVNGPFFAMVVKKYFNMVENEYDRKFLNEGAIATFDESIYPEK